MNSYILCFSLLVAGVAYTQAGSAALPSIDEGVKQVIEGLDALNKKFQEVTGIKSEFDKAKIEEFYKKNFGQVQEKLQELLKKLEADSGKYGEEFKKNVETFTKHFNENIKQFNNPEVQGKLQKLQEVFVQSLKKVVEQANEVGKSAGVEVPPSIHKTINEIYDEIYKSVQKVQEKVSKIVSDAQSELAKKKN